jgi:hypothetical protein
MRIRMDGDAWTLVGGKGENVMKMWDFKHCMQL